jgi:HEAT repeat protein
MGFLDKFFKPNVSALIRDLNGKNPHVRQKAAEALGETGDVRAVEPLIQALKDKDNWVRQKAAEALGKIGDARAIEPLLQALDEEDDSARHGIIEALARMGEKGVLDHLIKILDNKDSGNHKRGSVIVVLKMIGSANAVEPLIRALKDKDDGIRLNAAWALAEIGDARAVGPLLQALKDEYYKVQDIAAEALVKIADVKTVEAFTQALKDEHWKIRLVAAKALAKSGDARAVEPLIQALKDEDKRVREATAEALGMIGDARAVEPLIQSLNSYGPTQWDYSPASSAIRALGKIRDERAVAVLSHFLNESLKEEINGVFGDRKVVLALLDTDNRKAIQPIIDWLFQRSAEGFFWLNAYNAERALLRSGRKKVEDFLNRFFGSVWANIILEVSTFERIVTRLSDGYIGEIRVSREKSDQALQELCMINNPLSTNLLHKVAGREVKKVVDITTPEYPSSDWGQKPRDYTTIDYEKHIKIAKEELERRGNPPYDPSVYLEEKQWA